MQGAALRRKTETDLAVFTAYHTAVFALNGYAGKLKGLADYLGDEAKAKPQAMQHAQAIAFFHRLKARGVPVEITRH